MGSTGIHVRVSLGLFACNGLRYWYEINRPTYLNQVRTEHSRSFGAFTVETSLNAKMVFICTEFNLASLIRFNLVTVNAAVN